MLGARLDYLLLRPLTHERERATEDELNAAAADTPFDSERAMARLQRLIDRCDGRLVVDAGLSYLDVGCGGGEMAAALGALGAGRVTGVDIVPRHIVAARARAEQAGLGDRVDFVCADINEWEPSERYDVVMSHEALEHIENPQAFLKRLGELVKPDGAAVLAFGPLFHSPTGDHMWRFFRVQIPWRGVIFSERAIIRLRNEKFRPTDPVERYRDVQGGLNLMRYSEFLRYVRDTGWRFEYLSVNPQLRRYPVLPAISRVIVRVPWIRDYLASSVYCVLRRR